MSRAPLPHQVKELSISSNSRNRGLFWEQRCMKTGAVIRTADHMYREEMINAVVVIAYPNGVHRVWIDEWPKDWSEELPYKTLAWRSGKMEQRAARTELEELLRFDGMAVLTLNCEALLTKVAWNYLARFLKARKVLAVADESSWAQSPSSARTKRLLALGRHPNVVAKRILDGTPVDEGPLNIWSPCAFLDPTLLGHPSYWTFRNRYAVIEEGYAPGGRTFKKVVGYKNLEELNAKLATFSSRLRRSDISDAPPKLYTTRYFAMTPKQRAVYDRLRDEYFADVQGNDLPVANVLKRMIRLQMVARNFYPPEENGTVCPTCQAEDPECSTCDGLGYQITTTQLQRIDPDHEPALDALTEELKLTAEPTIIWCKFRQDVRDVFARLTSLGRNVCRYDGSLSEDEREHSYQSYRAGQYDDIVGTIESGLSRGKDLSRARLMVYYSNSYSLRARRQSEDRAESLSRTVSTGIVDLVAEDTRDLDIINTLRDKRSLAELVMGDTPERWI